MQSACSDSVQTHGHTYSSLYSSWLRGYEREAVRHRLSLQAIAIKMVHSRVGAVHMHCSYTLLYQIPTQCVAQLLPQVASECLVCRTSSVEPPFVADENNNKTLMLLLRDHWPRQFHAAIQLHKAINSATFCSPPSDQQVLDHLRLPYDVVGNTLPGFYHNEHHIHRKQISQAGQVIQPGA